VPGAEDGLADEFEVEVEAEAIVDVRGRGGIELTDADVAVRLWRLLVGSEGAIGVVCCFVCGLSLSEFDLALLVNFLGLERNHDVEHASASETVTVDGPATDAVPVKWYLCIASVEDRL